MTVSPPTLGPPDVMRMDKLYMPGLAVAGMLMMEVGAPPIHVVVVTSEA